MQEKNTRKIYTLTALGQALERHFMDQFAAKEFWVVAEITKINKKGAHFYLEIADSKENLTTAQFSAYIWSRNYQIIKEQLGEETEVLLKPGNKVLFLLKIDFHKVYGLKLNILQLDPNYSYGEIEKRKKETIDRLTKEGLIDLQKNLYFSTLTKRIALIGSPNTSGFRDFKEVLFNNAVFRKFKLKQFSSSVQGDKAKDELIKALKKARNYDVEAIVIIRGGGSKMDLDIFNNYELCKEICLTKIPVLTGIGHETDRVVADMVAHQYFITPTAVAKHLYVQIGNFNYFLNKYFEQVKTKVLERLVSAKDEFSYQNKYLVHHTKELVREWKDTFQHQSFQISKHSQRFLHSEREKLGEIRFSTHRAIQFQLMNWKNELEKTKNTLKQHSFNTLDFERISVLERIENKAKLYGIGKVDNERLQINSVYQMIELLSPFKILQSGYTISTVDNVDVLSLSFDLNGKEMVTLSANKLIRSKITNVEQISPINESEKESNDV